MRSATTRSENSMTTNDTPSSPTAPQTEASDPKAGRCAVATGSAPCKCWSDMDEKLREKGYKISDSCSGIVMTATTLEGRYYLPLQKTEGKRMGARDPKSIQITHCPFCGAKLYQQNHIISDSHENSR